MAHRSQLPSRARMAWALESQAAPAADLPPAAGDKHLRLREPSPLLSRQATMWETRATSSLPYTVSVAPSADVAVGDIPIRLSIERGKTGIYFPWAIDLSSNAANNVVVTSTFTVPNNVLNGGITGSYAVVTCSAPGCNSGMKGGTSCSVKTTVGTNTTIAVLTCNVGQLMSISSCKAQCSE